MPHQYPIHIKTNMSKDMNFSYHAELKIHVGSSRHNSHHLATVEVINDHHSDPELVQFKLVVQDRDIAKAVFKNNRGTAGQLMSIKHFNDEPTMTQTKHSPEAFKTAIEDYVQDRFNELVKPNMITAMYNIGLVKVEHVMGVDFFTFKDGKTLADSELEKAFHIKFYNDYIKPWEEKPWYSLINYDIDLKEPEPAKTQYQVQVVWNREFDWAKYTEPTTDLNKAIVRATNIIDSGDGARVKKARIINAETEAVVWTNAQGVTNA